MFTKPVSNLITGFNILNHKVTFAECFADIVVELTGLPLRNAVNKFEAIAAHDAVIVFLRSGVLVAHAALHWTLVSPFEGIMNKTVIIYRPVWLGANGLDLARFRAHEALAGWWAKNRDHCLPFPLLRRLPSRAHHIPTGAANVFSRPDSG